MTITTEYPGLREIIVVGGGRSIRHPLNTELSNEANYEAAAKALAELVFPGSRLVRQRSARQRFACRAYLFEA